jgi:hypothetical protein
MRTCKDDVEAGWGQWEKQMLYKSQAPGVVVVSSGAGSVTQ